MLLFLCNLLTCFPRLEENGMKKITVAEARKLLELGIHPKCEVSRDVFRPVKSTQELENFLSLSSYQKCQFYGYDENEIESFKVPDDAIGMSVEEATDMVALRKQIHARVIGENEQSFADLNSFFAFIKKCEINGDNFLLYLRD